jgi:hypothetical protein
MLIYYVLLGNTLAAAILICLVLTARSLFQNVLPTKAGRFFCAALTYFLKMM